MYNHGDICQNITMIIFLIFVLVMLFTLLIKLKIKVYIKVNGTQSEVLIKFLCWKFYRKGKFTASASVARQKNEDFKCERRSPQQRKKGKIFPFSPFKIIPYLKNFRFEKLQIYEEIGILEPNITALALPILSMLTVIPVKSLNVNYSNFRYKIVPAYMDLKFNVEVDAEVTFQLIKMVRSFILIKLK